jgi:ATP-dependent exoDNAse (exonuclease V) beta subunit
MTVDNAEQSGALGQSAVVDQTVREELLDISQSFIVQAPAGSGKTELLTQRILALLANVEKPESLLAITFTRKAAAEMRERVVSALRLALLPMPSTAHEQVRWRLAKRVLEADQKNGWNLIDNSSRLNLYTIDALSARLTSALPLLSQTGTIPAIAERAYPYYLQAAEQMLSAINSDELVADNIKVLLAHKDNNLKQVVDLIAQLLGKRLQWMGRINSQDHQLTCDQLFDSMNLIIRQNLQAFYKEFPSDILCEMPALLNQAADILRDTGKKGIDNLVQLFDVEPIAKPEEFDLTLWKSIAELLLTTNTSAPAFRKTVSKACGFPLAKDAENEQQAALFLANKTAITSILKHLATVPELARKLNDIRLLPDDIESAIDNPVLKAVTELLPISAGYLKLVFQQYNILDFSELSISSLNALGSDDAPSDLALALDYQIEHILIDEFQDTSTPQIRLLELLTAGWDASSHRTLFLVGDPMQSIYRFRDANVSLFMQIAQYGLGQIKPSFRQLQVNFRSKKTIIDWVNQQFSQLMPEQDDLTLSAVSYAPSIAFHEDDDSSQVNTWVTVDQNDVAAETKKILSLVKDHLLENDSRGEGESLKTLAILARSRAHFLAIIDLLNENTIAYQAVDIEPLSEKVVVTDITRLALALTDTYDQLSWTACFRSPWFSLGLNDIHMIIQRFRNSHCSFPDILSLLLDESDAIAKKKGVASDKNLVNGRADDSIQNSTDHLSEEGQDRLAVLLPILKHAINQKGRKPFDKWLMGCFEAVGGLLQIEIASEYQDIKTCIATISEFVDGGEILDRQGLELALDSLYAAPNPQADNQVQVMTIHKSKGLEFDRVILPRLDGRSAGVDAPLLKWTEVIDENGQSHNLIAVSKQTGKENDSIYRYISFLDKQKEKFENQRILYVAATRAKSELHLFANINEDSKAMDSKAIDSDDDGFQHFKKPQANSFIGMLWEGVKNQVRVIESNGLSQAVKPKAYKFTESELAEISTNESVQQQLRTIFPPRLLKRTNLMKVKSVVDELVLDGLALDRLKVDKLKADELKADGRGNTQLKPSLENKPPLSGGELTSNLNTSTTNLYLEQASVIGTVVHRQLEWLSKHSIESFKLPENWGEITESQLISAGLSRELVVSSTVLVMKAINKTLADKTGQFILSDHVQAKSELVLHKRLSSGLFLSRIVDRTFVHQNTRWIVDYKTAEPNSGESFADFIDKEVALYKLQMNDYVQLFKKIEQRPIKAGLYFPLLSHFETLYHR